jgi:putative ABC transport system permease protein
VYANYPYYTRVARNVDRAGSVQVLTNADSPAAQQQIARALEQQFERAGLRVSSTQTIAQLRAVTINQFNVILVFLLVMAALLAVVGALGLAGAMSINVLERTREIGVMRAVGATGRAVRGIVIGEGALIGVLSWSIGLALAVPISRVLSNVVGVGFLRTPLSYEFSIQGAFIWLAAVLVLSAAASLWPARNASRLSVREVLAYE